MRGQHDQRVDVQRDEDDLRRLDCGSPLLHDANRTVGLLNATFTFLAGFQPRLHVSVRQREGQVRTAVPEATVMPSHPLSGGEAVSIAPRGAVDGPTYTDPSHLALLHFRSQYQTSQASLSLEPY